MNLNKNVLITSVGRRVSLLNFFKNEAKLHNIGNVYCADSMSKLSSACQLNIDYVIKSIKSTSKNYENFLLETIIKNDIGLVIPTIDTELLTLSTMKAQLLNENCIAIVSDQEFIATCADKLKTAEFFLQYGIKTPKILDRGSLNFPCFVRPRFGSLSLNAFALPSKKHLSTAVLENEENVFTEYFSSSEYDEYTVDMYYNKKNKLCCAVPRKRIEIRGGEISKGVTVKSEVLLTELKKLKYIPGVVGIITAQFFINKKTNEIYGIEINPRFGGGYPLSFHAGANYPKMLIEEYYFDKEQKYNETWKDKTLFLRYDSEVVIFDADII